MNRSIAVDPHLAPHVESEARASSAARLLVPLGRAMFAAIFLMSGPRHFLDSSIMYAAGQGVPFAWVLVPLSGVLATLGGLSVLLGFRARTGAVMLIGFLVPVTLMMHNFWAVSDPMQAGLQQAMFFKNLSMMGAALMIAYFGPGPVSVDRRG